MNSDEFWNVLNAVANTSANPRAKQIELLRVLLSFDGETIIDFYIQFGNRVTESYMGDIYGAASILSEGHLSDDSFLYFRYWLISMGREIFYKMIADPDSVEFADIPTDRDGHPTPFSEGFYYAIHEAFEQVTGKQIYTEKRFLDWNSGRPARIKFDWQTYSSSFLEKRFPNLWSKYLEKHKNHEEAYEKFSLDYLPKE